MNCVFSKNKSAKILLSCVLATLVAPLDAFAADAIPAAGSKLPAANANKTITEADLAKVGTSIPKELIGEPVSEVTLTSQWVAGANGGYIRVDGVIKPVDPKAPNINFRVALPASWTRRSAQLGGGGMNGSIPNVTGGELTRGFATYGSDSGHQMGGMGGGMRGGMPGGMGGGMPGGMGGMPGGGMPGRGPANPPSPADPGAPAGAAPRGGMPGGMGGGMPGGMGGMPGGMGGMMGGGGGGAADEWTLNEEAVKNISYLQLKKTHDAAMVIIERVYGEKPRFNYYFGGSQGGREALTVVQRYPADYDGITADVPIVGFSTLMLAPELIRIQEKPLTNWVTPAKTAAIRAEFIRQCDKLDGLEDGIIYNYMAARAIFDMSQGDPKRNPWTALRAPEGKDPNPNDNTVSAKLTDGQIETLKMVYSKYKFATPLANGVTSFGMWVPNTDPSGSGLIVNARYKGQEGAAENAQNHSHMGVLGVTGFLMQDLKANPLDYVEGGKWDKRRLEISTWMDSLNPDLSAFYKRGGKMIVTIGTNDTLASPGQQLDYYQMLHDKMGADTLDQFARLFVLPQTGHGLSGSSANIDGSGKTIPTVQIPNQFNKQELLLQWVEQNKAPDKSIKVTAGARSQLMCSYPSYPKYVGGPVESADSYTSAKP